MATASSAQREPSMEEILASIRRIIEDSDGGRNQPVGAFEPEPAVEAVADGTEAEAAAPEIEVFRTELRAGNAEPEARKPVSLADVQAQLASGQPAPVARETAISAGAAPARSLTLAEAGGRAAIEQPETAEASARQRDETTVRPETAGAKPATDDLDDAEPQIDIDDDDFVLDDEPAPRPAAEAAMLRPSLVSEQTGRQVAAAFGELSEVFASRGKKSFDEMAEEMLRPMLQDWLDNNLPTLVERLVREEIERVARGGA